jgi:CRP/FNR family transcriptional regulator, cyclic AMP receptor protein
VGQEPTQKSSAGRGSGEYERAVRPGEVLFEAGDPGDRVFVVRAGHVELCVPGANAAVTVAGQVGPGEALGEADVLLGRPRGARAVAATEVHLLELDALTFQRMCLERPAIAFRLLSALAERLSALESRLGALGMGGLVRPLVRSLMRELRTAENGASATTTLRRLAETSGLSLGDAHRAMQELLDHRLVRLVDDTLLVPDPEALAACLDEASTASSRRAVR